MDTTIRCWLKVHFMAQWKKIVLCPGHWLVTRQLLVIRWKRQYLVHTQFRGEVLDNAAHWCESQSKNEWLKGCSIFSLNQLCRQSEAIKQRAIELETVKNIPCRGCQFNLFLFFLPQWEMMTTSWAWASSRRPSPQTRQSPYLTSCMNLRKGTSSRTSRPISTAKQRLPRRFTSSAIVSGFIRRTTPWRRRWMKTQVSEAHWLSGHPTFPITFPYCNCKLQQHVWF